MPKTRPGTGDRVQCLNTDTVPANLPAAAASSSHAHFHRQSPFPCTHKLYILNLFSRSLSIDSNFFSHALDYRSNQSISRRFFFFSLFDNSFLSSPFLSFYFLSFTRVLPLTPTLTRHLRNFAHYHWYGTITDAGGKKRISLVGG